MAGSLTLDDARALLACLSGEAPTEPVEDDVREIGTDGAMAVVGEKGDADGDQVHEG